MSYVIGIDTSTTATKALLVDRQGTVVATAATTYGFETTSIAEDAAYASFRVMYPALQPLFPR